MPWSIKKRGGKFCVVKDDDNSTVKCHATRAEALAQQRALYASEAKEAAEIHGKAEGGDGGTEVDHVKMYDEMPPYVPWGVTSFADLQAMQAAREYVEELGDLSLQFRMLADNIIASPDIADKAAALETLAIEFAELVKEPPADEEKEITPAQDEAGLFQRFKAWLTRDKPKEPETSGFMVWKEADGTLRWLARYSNNRRDQDQPPEIISAQSHKRFDELLSKGEAPMPELWLWHRPEWKWGVTTWHAYDDSGFPIAGGVVDKGKEFLAEHLMALDPALVRVSHGMPTSSIVRDVNDDSVIVKHLTREISPLPAWAAANQMTGFSILKEATDMTIPQDKRDALKAEWNLTDELLTQLEAANAAAAKGADEAGIEAKEVTAETTPAPTEPEPEVVPEVAPAPEAGISREELTLVLTQIGQAITALSAQVKELQGEVIEVKEAKAVQEAETLSEIFQRAIGNQATRVDGRTSEAKDRPKETVTEKPAVVNSGHPLADQIINSIVSGDWLGQRPQ